MPFYINFSDFATVSLKYALHNGHTYFEESILGNNLKATIIRTQAPQTSDACNGAEGELAAAIASQDFDTYQAHLAQDCGANSGMTCVDEVWNQDEYTMLQFIANLGSLLWSIAESKGEAFEYHHLCEQWTHPENRPRWTCWESSDSGFHDRRMEANETMISDAEPDEEI